MWYKFIPFRFTASIATLQVWTLALSDCSKTPLESLLRRFYGDLVYKFRKIIGKNDFPYHFKKIIVRYKKIGYNINVMRQTWLLIQSRLTALLTSLIAPR